MFQDLAWAEVEQWMRRQGERRDREKEVRPGGEI